MTKTISYIILIFICCFIYNGAIADNLLDDCKITKQDINKQDINSNKKNIREQGKNRAFSEHIKYNEGIYCLDSTCQPMFTYKDTATLSEINQDLILNCQNICLSHIGKEVNYSYQAKKRIALNKTFKRVIGNKEISTPYSVYRYTAQPLSVLFDINKNSNDTEKAVDAYFSIDLDKDKINVFTLDSSVNNEIFACGHKIITLDPIFPNMFKMSPDVIQGGNAMQLINTIKLTLPIDFYLLNVGNILKKEEKFFSNTERINLDSADLNAGFFFKSGRANSIDTTNTEWDEQTIQYHPCLGDKILSNKEVTNLQFTGDKDNTIINIDNYPDQVGCYPGWHIYNRKFVDLGIKISDGDMLKISWAGDMILGNGSIKHVTSTYDQILGDGSINRINNVQDDLDAIPFINSGLAKAIKAGADTDLLQHYSLYQENEANLLRLMSGLEFENLKPLIGEDGKAPEKPENDTIKYEICNNKTIYDLKGNDRPWYGLNGVIDRNAGIVNLPKDYKVEDGMPKNFDCKQTYIKPDKYSFNGILEGVGQMQDLKIRHYFDTSSTAKRSLYMNSIITGGYQVKIEWGGCPLKDGQGLEIALGNNDSSVSALKWTNIENDIINTDGYSLIRNDSDHDEKSKEFDPLTDTKVFFRVKTNFPKNDQHPSSGSYSIKASTGDQTQYTSKDTGTSITNAGDFLIKEPIKFIFESLIGDSDSIENGKDFNGMVIKTSIAICESINTLVKLSLALYISILGLGFMIGIIQMNQKELIGNVMKVAFVSLTLSPDSWNWFLQHFIRLFIIGGLELALRVKNILGKIVPARNFASNPDDLFNIFSVDQIFEVIFDGTLWMRLLSLALSSLSGLAIALLIGWCFIKTIKSVVQAIAIYFSSIITLSFLMMLSPLFFIMKLFKATSDMFDAFVKQVFLYTLMPTIITLGIVLSILLLLTAIDSIIGFGYCKICMIEWEGECLINGYYTIGTMFFPANGSGDFILPTGMLSGAFTFLIISEIVGNIVDLSKGIMARILYFNAQADGNHGNMISVGSDVVIGSGKGVIGYFAKNEGIKTTAKQAWNLIPAIAKKCRVKDTTVKRFKFDIPLTNKEQIAAHTNLKNLKKK